MAKQAHRPVEVPDKVKVDYKDSVLSIAGAAGKLELNIPPFLSLDIDKGRIEIKVTDSEENGANKKLRGSMKGMPGLYRALISSRIKAAQEGYVRTLNIIGVGYQAEVKGKKLSLKVGFSTPIELDIPNGVEVESAKGGVLTVKGVDPEVVGDFAARVRAVRPPEPYGGKGIRYEDEYVRRKVTKTAGAAG